MSYVVLIDCNNFFASCERVFNPRLEGRPVLILSNNDGCVVSCSQEVKKLGVTIGQPFFQIKSLCERHKIHVISSNFHLYSALSNRVMHIAAQMAPEIEIYSIDEAFLKFPETLLPEDVVAQCVELRRIVKQWIGIPTSLGIARTKTLAKVATKLAKKYPGGVFDLTSPLLQEEILKKFPLGDVWGIGSRIESKLHSFGMQTAWDLREADLLRVRRSLGVVGERMVLELRGMPCFHLGEGESKKSITRSRSFGRVVESIEEISEAVATHVSAACQNLRSQKSCAKAICVYLVSAKKQEDFEYQTASTTTFFTSPTNETAEIIQAAKMCVPQLFCQGKRYKKCGITLIDLIQEELIAPDLFDGKGRRKVSNVVDNINTRFGKKTLFYGAVGVDPSWGTRSDYRSSYYTALLDDLPVVKA
jgi:DNA polymerase V